jgi:hypothetical protein
MDGSEPPPQVVFATRLHLGHARTPPPPEKLRETVANFATWARRCGAMRAAIAVDATRRHDMEGLGGYDLVKAVEEARDAWYQDQSKGSGVDGGDGGGDGSGDSRAMECDVVPVSPWGKFVPALNALISWAAAATAGTTTASSPSSSCGPLLLFASAETSVAPESVRRLVEHLADGDTLVAGCALPGHDYRGPGGGDDAAQGSAGMEVPLTGRTAPWNTCAVWNLRKLSTTGFALVAEGLHPQLGPDGTTSTYPGPSGVEEASTIAVLQRTLPAGTAVAKLVRVPGVTWEVDWSDEERKQWHERKMASKVERAAVHLETLGLEGTVWHV